MSLRINHNLAALNAHRNLVNTTSALNNSMQKLSSGYRINKGSDDPAGLVISEQFRAQIAGLNRAIGNSEGSISMIQTAEGALTEINALLVSMRELAIHAANEGFNAQDQLEADQAEIDNAIATIDRIAANTQFGTKKLLDGTKENVATIVTTNTDTQATVVRSGLRTGNYALSVVKTADATSELNTTMYGLSLNNTDGDPYNVKEGVHNIDIVQASDVASKVGSQIAATDAWGNGLEINATEAKAAVAQTTAAFSADGSTNLAANAGTYTFIINYQEFGGQATGNQTITLDNTAGMTGAQIETALNNAISNNANLAGKVEAVNTEANANSTISFQAVKDGAQYSLRVEASSTDATTALFGFATAQSDRGISNGVLRFSSVTDDAGAVTNEDITLSDGTYTSVADIVTEMNTQLQAGSWGADDIYAAENDAGGITIATKDEGSTYSVKHSKLQATVADKDAMLVLGLTDDAQFNTGNDAIVNFNGYANTITDVRYDETTTYTLATAAYGETDRGTVELIVDKAAAAADSNGIQTGQMLLSVTGDKFEAKLDGGPATNLTAGYDGTIFNADRTEWVTINLALTSSGGNETISNTDQSLVFQIGGNVGQTARISLRNMSASSLGKNVAGNMFESLAKIDVTTAEGAQDAQELIDAAINEVSTTRGTLGSFQKNTLESNLRNLRIASQNLTASESQLRDTDMAQEMSEFTKNQILLQAGTSMLAQANQVPQVVLSLFG